METVTMDSIIAAMEKLDLPKREARPFGMIGQFAGVPVIENPMLEPVQKVKISDSFEWVTDECRAHINSNLLKLFGKEEPFVMVMRDASTWGTSIMAGRSTINYLATLA